MEKNGVIFDIEKYLEVMNMDLKEKTEREENRKRILEVKEIAIEREKNKKNDIGYMALRELSNNGFNTSFIGTQFFANLIEDLYYELEAYDASPYFDLTLSDNEHYTNLREKYKIKQEDFYRAYISMAIGSSESENKNINSLAYTIASSISKKLNSGKELVYKNDEE